MTRPTVCGSVVTGEKSSVMMQEQRRYTQPRCIQFAKSLTEIFYETKTRVCEC